MTAGDDPAAAAPIKLDAEGRQLQLDAEKAKLRAAIATARQSAADTDAGALGRLVPAVADAPKGTVTLGDTAGAFGPWRAHQVIDAAARHIAAGVTGHLRKSRQAARVLVVEDRALLPATWTARQVRDILDRLHRQLTALSTQTGTVTTAFAAALEAHDHARAAHGQHRYAGPRVGTEPTSAGAKPDESPGPGGANPMNPFGAALDLLGLLRTDYTLTASRVAAAPSELSTLVAAHIADPPPVASADRAGAPDTGQPDVAAEVDGFTAVRTSPTMDRLQAVLTARDQALRALSRLQLRLAPVPGELADLRARAVRLEQAWTAAVADAKTTAAIEQLHDVAAAAAHRTVALERAAAPAQSFAAQAAQVIADVDAAVSALSQPAAGGEAPLLVAVRRERFAPAVTGAGAVTHVLYANLDAIAADTVTRRSILGTAGLLRFLSAGTASWLLLDLSTGDIAGGGQVGLADVMTFSLDRGELHFAGTIETPRSAPGHTDPLVKLEWWAKVLVLLVVVALLVTSGVTFLTFFGILDNATP